LGEPHACEYISELHNCPVEISDDEDDEDFEDQISFVHAKLKELVVSTGKYTVLVRFKDGTWKSVAIPNRVINERKPKQMAYSNITVPGTDVSLVLISMFWPLVMPKASSIRADWTQPAF